MRDVEAASDASSAPKTFRVDINWSRMADARPENRLSLPCQHCTLNRAALRTVHTQRGGAAKISAKSLQGLEAITGNACSAM